MGSRLTTARSATAQAARAVPAAPAPSVAPARRRNDEWAALLRDMSGAIQSRSWDGTAIGARAAEAAHPSARAAAVRGKLPKSGTVKPSERQAGMLTQAELLAVYKLRRADARKWGPAALAERFDVQQADVEALLRYTRTYTAHTTPDGAVRGLYDAHALPPLERFEDVR